MSDYYLLCLDCLTYRYLSTTSSEYFHEQAAKFLITHAKHSIQSLTFSDFTAQDITDRYATETD